MTILDTFLDGYLEAAVWASNDLDCDRGTPLDESHGVEDFTPKAVAEARKLCAGFLEANAADVAEAMDAMQRDADWIGHDFWLTRNGHGAGFWDRGLGELGERLTKASEPYGQEHPLIGEDGKLSWLGG